MENKNGISRLPNDHYESFLRAEILPTFCRVCLSESQNLIPMKDICFVHNLNESRIETEVDLLSVLKQFYNIDISDMKLMPQYICEQCVDLASKAFNFLQLFLYSSKIIHQKLESDTIKQTQHEPCLSEYETSSVDSKTIQALTLSNDTDNEVIDLKCDEVIFNDDDDEETIVEIKEENVQNLHKAKPVKKKTQEKPTVKPWVKPAMTKKFAYENNIFMCGICLDKTFDSLDGMLEHVREEHNSVEHCVICRSVLKSPEKRRYHYASHSAKSIVCRACRLVFQSVEELEQHKLTIEHSDKKMCTICHKRFVSRPGMLSHMKEMHGGKKKFQCAQCGATFSRKANMEVHEERHKGYDGFSLCPHCGIVRSSNFVMKIHIQKKHNIDMGMEAIIKSRLAAHQKRKAEISGKGLIRYPCKHCDLKFCTHSRLMKHCGTHPDFSDFICIKCDVTFNSLKDYLEHEKTHPRYPCAECSKMFNSYSARAQHKEKHKAKYRCNICGLISVSKVSLAMHKIIHTGEKPFKCETCGKNFRHRGVLRSHILAVHGTKPWECHLCKKKFLYNSNAVAHLRTHTGVKPFSCPYCDKKFRDTISRHKHVKSAHPEFMEQFKMYKAQHQEEEVRKAETMI